MFKSFFLAGFECATGYNMHGEWIDQIEATGHDEYVSRDYAALAKIGIHSVREAVRWPLVDRGKGKYDFSSVDPFVAAAKEHQVEVIWDLFHYGYPDGVDLFSADFAPRFADYCAAVAEYITRNIDGPYYFTPINEPSFFAWAAGDVGRFAPHASGRGPELKKSLARAGIQGINAIRSVCPSARIVNVDPLCRVAPADSRPESQRRADYFNNVAVFESWDYLCGRLCPELGGSREHLDIIGVNYYWTNQWQLGTADSTPLEDHDPRRAKLSTLIRSVWDRYGGDILITETSHVGEMRPVWLREAAAEANLLLESGIPLRGITLYPILGMPEWHDRETWTLMGLWDPGRQLFTPMLSALKKAQQLCRVKSAA
jgi:hypothetical protein